MKFRFIALAISFCCAGIALSLFTSQTTNSQKKNLTDDSLSQPERDLMNEINQCRAHPQLYASYLEKLKPLFRGKEYKPEGEDGMTTQEGWGAVEDAIKFLRASKPLGPLGPSHGLYLAAASHVKDQSSTGTTGHRGTDKALIEQRVKPFGIWQGAIGENLTYGAESARERLLTWLIDDGVPSRGHRQRLLSNDYKVAGISCGPHPEYGAMCVLTLAGSFTEAQNSSQFGTTMKSTKSATTKSRKM